MEKEIKNPLSNYSYTDKDFNAVWSELLELTSKISAKWDPVSSNESDPGVVIIKLISLLADKLNYNIDANVLENFPSTVAQLPNAREVFSVLGYTMKWYKSGTGTAYFQFKIGDESVSSDTNSTAIDPTTLPNVITIPRFTMICDEDVNNIYTLLDSVTVYTPSDTDNYGKVSSVPIQQGIIMDYELFGEKKVTAENLDDKFRLYFTETNIAENGIFITNASLETPNYTEWERVENLNTQKLGTKCYKFGVTRDGVCYLEFPSDIAPLIVDGIYIKYLLSDGLSGNIAKYTLKKFYNNPSIPVTLTVDGTTSDTNYVLSEDNISIYNNDAIINGQDPESIESAYNNYSKTVGVFDTLVSLRDYTDAIYRIGHNLEIVSNDIVSNRRTDIQSSYSIMTRQNNADVLIHETVLRDSATYLASSLSTQSALLRMPFEVDENDTENEPYGGISELALIAGEPGDGHAQENPNDDGILDDATVTLSLRDLRTDAYEISPFDLRMYLLHYNADPSSSLNNYNRTFTLVTDIMDDSGAKVADYEYDIINQVLDSIDQTKHVEHTFIPQHSNRPCLFINTYPVQAVIVPQYKLTSLQVSEIKTNVYSALFDQLNSMKIDFGEAVTYDEVYDIISGADERIKSVVLEPLTFTTNVLFYSTAPDYETDGYTIKQNSWNLIPFTINTVLQNDNGDMVNWGLDCYAKSVLAGVTPLFSPSDSFHYSLNQTTTGNPVISEVKSIDTEANLNISSSPITLKKNENVYIQAPSYVDTTSYSSSIKLEYNFPGNGYVEVGTDFTIPSGGFIVFYYKTNDTDTYYQYRYYGPGAIVKSSGFSFELGVQHSLSTTSERSGGNVSFPLCGEGQTVLEWPVTGRITQSSGAPYTILSKYTGSGASEANVNGNILSSTKSVIVRKKNIVELTSNDNFKYYWVLNKTSEDENGIEYYRLFEANDGTETQTYSLAIDEYLLAISEDAAVVRLYGAGTRIQRASADGTPLQAWDVDAFDVMDIYSLSSEDLLKMSVSLEEQAELTITEMQFIALGEGASIQAGESLTLDNNPQIFTTYIEYKTESDADWTRIDQITGSDNDKWRISSALNLDMSVDSPQILKSNQNMTITQVDGTQIIINGTNDGVTLQSSSPIILEGGDNLNVSLYDYYTSQTAYPDIFRYTSTSTEDSTDVEPTTAGVEIEFNLPAGKYILPCHIKGNSVGTLTVKVSDNTNMTLGLLNHKAPSGVSHNVVTIQSPQPNTYYYLTLEINEDFYVSDPAPQMKLIIQSSSDSSDQLIIFEKLVKYEDRDYSSIGNVNYAPDGQIGRNFMTDVIERMNDLDDEGKFNYAYEVPDDVYISDPLNPNSFLNKNHIFNAFTICKITPSNISGVLTNDIVVTNKIK